MSQSLHAEALDLERKARDKEREAERLPFRMSENYRKREELLRESREMREKARIKMQQWSEWFYLGLPPRV
ncbi:MAG: hypothetical protein WA021_05550 [Minisyncoccia bacterium]